MPNATDGILLARDDGSPFAGLEVRADRLLLQGNVGIGTTNPAAKLDVRGQVRATTLTFTDAGGAVLQDNWIGMANNIDGTSKWLHIGGITDAGERRMTLWADRIYLAGRVGIGTTNPQGALQVKSLTVLNEGGTTAGAWANLGSNAFYDGTWKRVDLTKAGVNLHMNADGAGAEFRFARMEGNGQARAIAQLGTGASFIAEGNLGIGTTNPAARLHVAAGDIRLDAARTISAPGRLHIAGDELLYVLNRNGMIVGKEWGGNGNLTVQGDVLLAGRIGVHGQPAAPRNTRWAGGIHTWDIEVEGSAWCRNGWEAGPGTWPRITSRTLTWSLATLSAFIQSGMSWFSLLSRTTDWCAA